MQVNLTLFLQLGAWYTFQALLELNAPTYSVLSPQPLPPASTIPLNLTDSMNAVLSIAQTVVANRSISNGNITGPQLLMNDTSAADPASLGMAVLLASWTGQWFKDGLNYAGAAQDQLDYLIQHAPHTSDGAISHLSNEVQLWVRVLSRILFLLFRLCPFIDRATLCTWSRLFSRTTVSYSRTRPCYSRRIIR